MTRFFTAKMLSIIFTLILLTSCSYDNEIIQSTPSSFVNNTKNILDQTPTTGFTSAPTTTPSLTVLQNSITPSSVMPTVCLGFEPTPISTPLPWINDPNGYWEKIAKARLPIQGHECTAPYDIVNQLVHQWLDTIKVNSPHLPSGMKEPCGLIDYKVGTISIRPDSATNVNTPTPQYDIVAFVDYEVNIGGFSDCGWIPDRGELEGNGWIKTHDPFGVYRQDGFYQLVVLPGWGS